MTIEATFADGGKMLFGDSYKRWWIQLSEYVRRYRTGTPRIRVSRERWIGFGGLKWCSPEMLPHELELEGEGRNVDQFEFRNPTRIEINILNKHCR